MEGHDDVVDVKNKEEALIAAEARYTKLNGRFEEGLVKMDRMFASVKLVLTYLNPKF